MFTAEVYQERRRLLMQEIGGGLVLLPGNPEAPINYGHNTYPFRQDSTFLYYIGVDRPGMAAVVDVDSGETTLYGEEPSLEAMIWTGAQPSLAELGQIGGIPTIQTIETLPKRLKEARLKGRKIHYLPPYRGEVMLSLARWLGIKAETLTSGTSVRLMRAVVKQRSRKSRAELDEFESALEVTQMMHLEAMKLTRPGMKESAVAGRLEGLVRSRDRSLAYPVIFSIRGEVLHNLGHENTMVPGALVLNDSGAESPFHYASDITRTFPVTGKFASRQKELYELVLAMQTAAIEQCQPRVPYRDVHLKAARVLVEGLVSLGLMKGDPEEAVATGAYSLFFPHGLGHMLGLDVHDMENLGEDFVGYDRKISRSRHAGLEVLRFGRALEPGFVVTVEPGVYFIPDLIDYWRVEGRGDDFIDFNRLENYKSFGGIRIEDDIVVTKEGCRVLGPPIPKTVNEIEASMAV